MCVTVIDLVHAAASCCADLEVTLSRKFGTSRRRRCNSLQRELAAANAANGPITLIRLGMRIPSNTTIAKALFCVTFSIIVRNHRRCKLVPSRGSPTPVITITYVLGDTKDADS